MSNDERPFNRKRSKRSKKNTTAHVWPRILLLFTYFSIETQVCTFICVVNTHTVAYASQIENIKWIYDKYCKSWATFGTGILRNMAICAEDDDINDIRRRLSRYGNIIKKFERELRSSWTNSFSSGGRVFVDDQSGIYIKIHTHEYPTTLILDKIDKKSCWDSEFSSHFGCVQHPHPHFHIMFYSMQFPFSKPPMDWLYLGYSGPGVSGKGFLGNWKSHSRFNRNTRRGRELENATGREGKFEARNPRNPGKSQESQGII